MPEQGQNGAAQLDFIVTVDDTGASEYGDKGIFSSRSEPFLKAVPVEVLKTNIQDAISGLRDVFSDVAQATEGLVLQQIQVGVEVTAGGKVALVGTSVEASGKGIITLTFSRQ
jgi:hypothetical protein